MGFTANPPFTIDPPLSFHTKGREAVGEFVLQVPRMGVRGLPPIPLFLGDPGGYPERNERKNLDTPGGSGHGDSNQIEDGDPEGKE